MVPFTADLRRLDGLDVRQVRYRYRGWNEPYLDPVRDLEGVLAGLTGSVVLVGHSMGGRTALRAAGDPRVRAVCALAPWLPDGEPVDHLAGRHILVAHGDRDRITIRPSHDGS